MSIRIRRTTQLFIGIKCIDGGFPTNFERPVAVLNPAAEEDYIEQSFRYAQRVQDRPACCLLLQRFLYALRAERNAELTERETGLDMYMV